MHANAGRGGAARRRNRRLTQLLAAVTTVTLLSALLVLLPTTAGADTGQVLIDDSFTGATTDAPVLRITNGTAFPCLTRTGGSGPTTVPGCPGAVDSAGDGALRLTEVATSQASALLYNQSVPLARGLTITFDQYQYGGSAADGIAFILAVGQPTFTGPNGGSLGYSHHPLAPTQPGFPGGWLGIGLDVFGNFSNPDYNGAGCPASGAFTQNALVVRGPGNGLDGYCLLKSQALGFTLHDAATRANAKRSVKIVIDPVLGKYTISIDPAGGTAYQDLFSEPLPSFYYDPTTGNVVNGRPERITFGLTASTGGSTDVHEVTNVLAKTLTGGVPKLAIDKTDNTGGTPAVGGTFSYTLTPRVASDSPVPETNPTSITVTDQLPNNISLNGPVQASSDWSCTAPASTITCHYQTAGDIPAGMALSPITLPVKVSASAVAGTVISNTATVVSSDAASPASDADDVTPVDGTGTVTAALAADHTTVLPGALTVPTAQLPPATVGSAPGAAGALSSTPISSIDLQSKNGVQSTPISSIPISSIPISSIPISSIPISSIGTLKSTLLSSIPVTWPAGCTTNCTGWPGLLAGTPLANAPLQSLSLYDVLADASATAKLKTLSFGALDLASTPISSIPISSILLAATPISSIPLPGSGTPLQNWCDLLASLQHSCASLGINPANPVTADTTTLFTLALAGVPISSIPISSIPISSIPISSIPISSIGQTLSSPISSIPISSIDLAATPISSIPISSINVLNTPISSIPISSIPISSIPISSISSVFTCYPASCTTVGQAYQQNAIAPGTTLGQLGVYQGTTLGQLVANPNTPNPWANIFLPDVIRGLLSRADYPWEAIDLDAAALQAAATAGGHLVLTETLTVTSNGVVPVTATFALPPGFRYEPGTASLTPNDAPASLVPDLTTPGSVRFVLPLGTGVFQLGISVQPGITLGNFLVGASAHIVTGPESTASQAITVADSTGPDNTPAQATALTPNTINLNYLTSQTDLDYWKLVVPDHAQVSLSLSNLPTDVDLVLYSPSTAPLRAAPEEVLAPVTETAPSLTPGTDSQSAPPSGDVPIDHDLAVYSTSANRGSGDERINTAPLPGGTYIVQVSGYNGATSQSPYALRAQIIQGAGVAACDALTLNPPDPNVVPPSSTVPAGVNTLFLVNSRRLGQMYGATSANAVLRSVEAVAGATNAGVKGAIIDVQSDDTVRNAFTAWDLAGNRCQVDSAKAVVTAIGNLVDAFRAAHPTVANLVIVGADDQIPMGRVEDHTTLSNEREEATNFAGNNPLVASLAGGYVLTDDPYANRVPLGVGGASLYRPELALGRLVETPQQIKGALDRFVATNGVLTAATGLTTGYDFLTSGAHTVGDALQVDLDDTTGAQVARLINETWNAGNLKAALAQNPDLASVNAHFDHNRALPAAGNTSGNQSDLFTTADVSAANGMNFLGNLLFSMGCHAGLNVPANEVGGVNVATWAKMFADQGALWLANTGYGYADSEVIALSARLMTDFAQFIDGNSIGAALAYAKQSLTADKVKIDAYIMKSSMEATLYGLPMYRLNGNAPTPPTPVTPQPVHGDPLTGLQTASFGITPNFELHTSGPRSFYTADGQAENTVYRPIQPLETVDVTQPGPAGSLGLIAHGALITSLTTEDHNGFLPAWSRPTVDDKDREPAVGSGDDTYPSAPQRVSSFFGPDGNHQQVAMVVGQFLSGPPTAGGLPGPGTQRLFTNLGVLVHYLPPNSPGAHDFTPPTIVSTIAATVGSSVAFTVRAVDDTPATDTVKRVLVLYTNADNPGTWTSVDLTKGADGSWAGGGASPGEKIAYIVQAVDSNGNVSVSSNKGVGHNAVAVPIPPTGDFTIQVDATPGHPVTAGFYTSPVKVSVVGGSQPMINVDGTGFVPYTGPIDLTADGVHKVLATRLNGDPVETLFAIDATGPNVTATVTPAAGPTGWNKPGANVVMSATDGGGSGVQSLTWSLDGGAPTLVNGDQASKVVSTNGQHTFSYSALDKAGNQSGAGTFVVRIDGAAPVVSCGAVPGWSKTDVTLPCTATDPSSGLADPSQATFSLSTHVPAGTETPSALTDSATVCDVVGNCNTAGPFTARVDKKPPAVTLTAPANGAVYEVGQKVTVKFSCTDGGSSIASCVGTAPNNTLLNTLLPGARTFKVTGTDVAGNKTEVTATYAVTFKPCEVKVREATREKVKIELEVCTSSGINLSADFLVVTAVAVDGQPAVPFKKENPGNVFQFKNGPDHYEYTGDTKNLAKGTHTLTYSILFDPVIHSIAFTIK